MNIKTKEELLQAVKTKRTDIVVDSKLANTLYWSLLSSQTSLFVRLPVIIVICFVLLASNGADSTISLVILFLAIAFILLSIIVDIFLATRIGYGLAKTVANRYLRQSYTKDNLVLKLRTDI